MVLVSGYAVYLVFAPAHPWGLLASQHRPRGLPVRPPRGLPQSRAKSRRLRRRPSGRCSHIAPPSANRLRYWIHLQRKLYGEEAKSFTNYQDQEPDPSTKEDIVGTFSIWHWLIVLIITSPAIIGLAVMGPQRPVTLTHPQTGVVKNSYVGWCWPYYLIGWLLPIFRGEIGVGLIQLLLTTVTLGISGLIMPFLYNKQHMNRLLLAGWQKNGAAQKIPPQSHRFISVNKEDSNTSSHTSRIVAAEASQKNSQLPTSNISTDVDGPDEDAIYTIVADELESGKTDKGLWTRLFAECKGDEKQVKVQYITRRVTKLLAAETHKKEQFAFDESVRQKQLKIAEVETERLRRQNAGLADPGLIWAVSHGNWASAKQLLVNGVSPFGMNDDGITLLDIAKKMRDQDMINLLIAHGALE